MVHKTANIRVPVRQGNPLPVEVRIIDVITCPIQKYAIDVNKNSIMTQVPLADPPVTQHQSVAIDMLIGLDHYYDFVGPEQIQLNSGIVLLQSKFGYISTGKVDVGGNNAEANSVVLFRQSFNMKSSDPDIERFWSLEDIGILDNPHQWDDDRALEQFNKSIRLENGRYAVTFPWKDPHPNLPTNYQLALGRLKSLVKKFNSNPEIVATYDKTIQDQLVAGVIEEVGPTSDSELVHYLPHHAVVKNDQQTTKLRIVYDGSAKTSKESSSLNDCLLRGPVIMEDLCGMLLRFRKSAIAMVSDVEKAFLQVAIQEKERDVTRFLYPRDWSKPLTPSNLLIYRFCRVPFGLISSSFLLGGTIQFHLNHQQTSVANDISDNLYVDNVGGGRNNLKESMTYYDESKSLFAEIAMNLREWYSNSREFIENIRPEDRGKSSSPKFLGMRWDVDADSISCPGLATETTVATKRCLLSAISQVFDPCGLFSPVIIRGKIIIQDLWKQNLSWDAKVPEEFVERFQQIEDDLINVSKIAVPRIINDLVTGPDSVHELHCFCDASAKAYAAVVYLRSKCGRQASSGLVFSKSRLAPMKTGATSSITIPRLELMAAVIGVRIADFVKREIRLPVEQVFIWSDSKTVLRWLRSTKVLPVFVQRRITEIKKHPHLQFRYVPSECNPADLPTREFSNLQNMGQFWWNGPAFLTLSVECWPESELQDGPDEQDVSTKLVASVSQQETVLGIGSLIDRQKFSTIQRLVRVSAWCMRFINKSLKRPLGPGQTGDDQSNYLSVTEMAASLRLWVIEIQSSLEPILTNSRNPMNRQLGLFKDADGIIRCKGRLEHSNLSESAKFPILLPKADHLSDLLILDCHERLYHSGARQTLAQLRLDYWIPHGMAKVRKLLRKCLICRKAQGGAFRVPESPPLPWFRVNRSYPFACTGVDYIGPLFVSDGYNQTYVSKVWISLFTCATTRAIHLEVVEDLSAAQFLMCLRRFTSLHRKPTMIISDNAKHFKAADSALQILFREPSVQDFVANQGIQWKFITEKAPWMGGFYERLVATVKSALKKSLGRLCLTLVQFQTVVTEISCVINSRPLIPVDGEIGEMVLTPGHFLHLGSHAGFPRIPDNDDYVHHPSTTQDLLNTWSEGQKILDGFWRIWTNEYLAELRQRSATSLTGRNASEIGPAKGVIVLIKENLPRCRWKMAKIDALHQGKDGRVRTATLILPSGRKLNRPLKLLYPIEQGLMQAVDGTEEREDPADLRPKDPDTVLVRRPNRKAAEMASARIRDQFQEDESDGSM